MTDDNAIDPHKLIAFDVLSASFMAVDYVPPQRHVPPVCYVGPARCMDVDEPTCGAIMLDALAVGVMSTRMRKDVAAMLPEWLKDRMARIAHAQERTA